jgi:hypothetical protein
MLRATKLALLIAIAVAGCSRDPASRIIDKTRDVHGSAIIDTATIHFDFRGDIYVARRSNGLFEYSRSYVEDGAEVRDIITNDSTFRLISGAPVSLDDGERRSIESRVNSVIYFALLPYNLADPAVRSAHLGEVSIRGEPYDAVEVTFEEDGGGRDWQDRYVYWIHSQSRTMDFLAYSFHDDDGGGSRFREAVNPRQIAGVRFQDYLNYTVDTLVVAIEQYPDFLDSDALELVSTVEIDEIVVHHR